MPGEGSLVKVYAAGVLIGYAPPGVAALEVESAAGVRTVAIDSAGAISAFTSTDDFTVTDDLTVQGQAIVDSANAAALVVGPNGETNPVFQVDAATASAATGLKVTGAAAAGGVAVAVVSSGTNEALEIDAKGTGTIGIGTNSTGAITLGASSDAAIIANLPTSDPQVAGQLWADSGAVKVSAGGE